MQKDLFIEIIAKRQFIELLLLTVSYFIYWYIIFILANSFLGNTQKLSFKKFYIAILIMLSNSIVGKLYIPTSIYGVEMIILLFLLFLFTWKQNVWKSLWIALLAVILSAAGDIFIIVPLCLINKDLSVFFANNGYGNILAAVFECIGPVITLLIRHRKSQNSLFSIFPLLKEKSIKIDIISLITHFVIIYFAYTQTMQLLQYLMSSTFVPSDVVTNFIVASMIMVGVNIIIFRIKKDRQRDHDLHELEKQELQSKLKENMDHYNYFCELLFKYQDKFPQILNGDNTDDNNISLTAEEIEIVKLIIEGKNNSEIAITIHSTSGTVRNRISKILDGLGLANRTQLAAWAIKNLNDLLESKK